MPIVCFKVLLLVDAYPKIAQCQVSKYHIYTHVLGIFNYQKENLYLCTKLPDIAEMRGNNSWENTNGYFPKQNGNEQTVIQITTNLIKMNLVSYTRRSVGQLKLIAFWQKQRDSITTRFRNINSIVTKDRCSLPMDTTVELDLHKVSLQATVSHHTPSSYSGHYFTSAVEKKTFLL